MQNFFYGKYCKNITTDISVTCKKTHVGTVRLNNAKLAPLNVYSNLLLFQLFFVLFCLIRHQFNADFDFSSQLLS